MKEIVITLLILVSSNKIEQKDLIIFESCYTWYQKNIEMTEKKTTLFSRRSFHWYEGQRVVGYICNHKEPFSEH